MKLTVVTLGRIQESELYSDRLWELRSIADIGSTGERQIGERGLTPIKKECLPEIHGGQL